MIAEPLEVLLYQSADGLQPFSEWLSSQRDPVVRQVLLARITRLGTGNFGDCKQIENIFELRIQHGSGFRIYFGKKGKKIVILLHGGIKRTQQSDIQTAKDFWRDYVQRTPRSDSV